MADAKAEEIAEAISTRGWCVVRDFAAPAMVRALNDEAQAAWHAGQFEPAGIGRGARHNLDSTVRGDATAWIESASAASATTDFLAWLESLRQSLNARCYLGLFDVEAHFARYDEGARYARHLDRFCDDSARTVSCVLYLNATWQPADGGQLRLETGDGRDCEVLPEGGTLVVFLSETFPHEVLPSHRERWSIAAWLRTRPVQ